MPFADYRPAREAVSWAGGGAEVRGLSLDDVSRLVRTHYADLEALVDLYQDRVVSPLGGALDPGLRMDELVLALCREAPQFAATCVLLAADEAGNEDAERAVRSLPVPVMVDALLKVGRLTFQEAGGVRPFLEALAGLLGRVLPREARDAMAALAAA